MQPVFLRHTKSEKHIYSCFSALLLFCLSHVTRSLVFVLHLVTLSTRPSLEKEQHLCRLSTLLVLVHSQTFSSLFCASHSAVCLSASVSHRDSKIEKHHFSESGRRIVGRPAPTARALQQEDQMAEKKKKFASSVF